MRIRTPRIRRAGAVAALALAAALDSGCAAYFSLTMPGPADDEAVQLYMHRSSVESTLRTGAASEFDKDGLAEVRYHYSDGPAGWSKMRAVFYVAADVFTIFLSELIFWPIEVYSKSQIERIAVADYSPDNRLLAWQILRKDGAELLHAERRSDYDRQARLARAQRATTEFGAPSSEVMRAPDQVTTNGATVEFEVTVTDFESYPQVLVEGEPVDMGRDGTVRVRRAVPVGTSSLTVTALDVSGAGVARQVTVFRVAPERTAGRELGLGRYHALVIGNENYAKIEPLRTARADAEAVATLLRNRYGYAVELLLDADRATIVSTLARYRAELTPSDNLLIYYAGHGVFDPEEDHGYWLPVDAERNDPSAWVANASVTRQLKAMEAKHVLVVADSCYSGTLMRGLARVGRDPGHLDRLVSRRSRTALTSGGDEPVADGSGPHSAFAAAFLRELEQNEVVLEAAELFQRVRRAVELESAQRPRYAPIVSAGHEDGEFLFVPAPNVAAAPPL